MINIVINIQKQKTQKINLLKELAGLFKFNICPQKSMKSRQRERPFCLRAKKSINLTYGHLSHTNAALCTIQRFSSTRPWPAFGRRTQNGSSGGDQFGICERLTPCFTAPALSSEGKQLLHLQARRSLFCYRDRYTPLSYIYLIQKRYVTHRLPVMTL